LATGVVVALASQLPTIQEELRELGPWPRECLLSVFISFRPCPCSRLNIDGLRLSSLHMKLPALYCRWCRLL